MYSYNCAVWSSLKAGARSRCFRFRRSRRFSVHVAAGTVLNLLIETARAHGELVWTIPGEKARLPGRDPVDFAVEYKTFDGDSFSLGRFLEKP